MEFKIKRGDFLKGLQVTQSIAESKTTMPILSNVLLKTISGNPPDTAAGILELYATNLEIGTKGRYQCTVLKDGSIAVNGRQITDIIREMPDDEIHLTLNDPSTSPTDGWLAISCQKSYLKIPCLPPDDFPSFPSYDDVVFIEVSRASFKDMIRKVIIAISPDETRPALSGALLTKNDNVLSLVATNGHRLSIVENDIENSGDIRLEAEYEDIIIPRKGLLEIIKLSEGEGRICLGVKGSHAILKIGNNATEHGGEDIDSILLAIRLIGHKYPNYKAVLPRENNKRLTVDKEAILQPLRRVSILADDTSKMIKLSLKRNILCLSSVNKTNASAYEEVDVLYECDEMDIGLNVRYLLDMLGMVDGRCFLDLKDPSTGIIVSFDNDPGFKHIIMPMRIEEEEDKPQ